MSADTRAQRAARLRRLDRVVHWQDRGTLAHLDSQPPAVEAALSAVAALDRDTSGQPGRAAWYTAGAWLYVQRATEARTAAQRTAALVSCRRARIAARLALRLAGKDAAAC